MAAKDNKRKVSEKLRQRAEVSLSLDNAAKFGSAIILKKEELLHELKVHQIELEMQNEELRVAQNELELSRARYFDLYEMAPVGYCLLSNKGLILEANLMMSILLDISRDRIIKRSMSSFILKEDHEIFYMHIKKFFEKSEPGTYGLSTLRLRLVKENGKHFWVRIDASEGEHRDGLPVCNLVIIDINEIKRTQDELKISEEKHRLLFETMVQGVIYRGSDGRIISANKAAKEMFGLSLAQMDEKASLVECLQAIKEDLSDLPRDECPWKIALKSGKGVYGTVIGIIKPNSEKQTWLNINAIPQFKPGESSPYLVYSTIEDITSRKKAESYLLESHDRIAAEELRKREERFDIAIQGSRAGVWDWDMLNDKIIFSTRFKSMLGYKDNEGDDSFLWWKKLIYSDDLKLFEKKMEDHLSGRDKYFEVENRLLHKDGSWRWVATRGEAIRDLEGRPHRWVGTNIDITEQKNAEKKLLHETELSRDMAEKAKAASDSKSEFLSNISHEIRTPINGVIGFAQLCLNTNLTPRQKNYIDKINLSAKYLLMLVNDVLDFSEVEAGKTIAADIPFILDDVLKISVNQFINQSQNKGLKLLSEVKGDVPAKLIGDPIHLMQILINLISNAVKFTEKGKIVIGVKLLNKKEDRIYLQFSVKDTGMGMSGEQTKSLFENFYQADAKITRKFGGVGIGLPLISRLVELLGGKIWAKSTLGKGSTFYFSIEFGETRKKDSVKEIRIKSELEATSLLRGARVLLVEDNEINQEFTLEILRGAGMKVKVANNGLEAVNMVKDSEYDIVLMDIRMPVMDGYHATAEIRKNFDSKALPIIAVTASAMSGDQTKSLLVGMNDHIAKPFNTALLLQKMSHLVMVKKNITLKDDSFQNIEPKSLVVTAPALGKNPDFTISGIDVKTVLIRLGGDYELFDKILIKFYENYKNDFKEIRQMVRQGNIEAAANLVHDIKGVAANISATDIYNNAAIIEADMKLKSTENLEMLLSKLECELEATLDSILRYLKER